MADAPEVRVGVARMRARQARRTYPFAPRPEIASGDVRHYPVAIVGGGPVGLTLALDLAQHGVSSVILERSNTVSDGSRAICWAKRTLEICDRLGVGERMLAKGVTWNTGKVYFGDNPQPIYSFDLLPDKQQKFPAFINLQQYYAEEYLIDRLAGVDTIDLRWQNEVVDVADHGDHVSAAVRTPAGEYGLTCDYLIAADGHRSPVRTLLDLDFEGRIFEDHFLIADVRLKTDFPAERRFWFDPPFNPGQTALIHQQPDRVYRIDFQMGWDVDRDEVLKEENITPRIKAFLGEDVEFDYEWVSLYTFQCRRMQRFVHNRIIFAGDAAHLVSPFGARGANGGIQDADNLAWKLALVLHGRTSPEFIESYNTERVFGADENVTNSARSTDFMTPKSDISRAFRDATLELARDFEFARRIVNSGRLSVPCVLSESPLNTPDEDAFSGKQRPGAPCLDAPVAVGGKQSWLLNQLGGCFVGLCFDDGGPLPAAAEALAGGPIPVHTIRVSRQARDDADLVDTDGLVARYYDAAPGSFYLIRPDQHVAARWRRFDPASVEHAVKTATGG